MTIGAAGGRGKRVSLPWRQLPRRVAHRTSEPTSEAVERAIAEAVLHGGGKPIADAALFAALRFAMRTDMAGYIDEIRAVEQGTYTVWRQTRAPDPGE